MASVQELIAASQQNKSPLIKLLEGAATGFGQAQQGGLDRTIKLIQLDQMRQEQEQQRQMQEQISQQLALQNENATKQNFNTVSGAPKAVMPAMKLKQKISQDEKGRYSRSFEVVDTDTKKMSLEDRLNAEVGSGRMTLQEAYNMKAGGIKPELAYKMQQDAAEKAGAESEKTKSRTDAFATYETARDALLSGLEETVTGPIAGRLPAITGSQQLAESVKAQMAPILKQLFRSAGEGVFTDRDQALLLDMIPDRTVRPEARKKIIENLDAIVKAKLGMGGVENQNKSVEQLMSELDTTNNGDLVNMSDEQLERIANGEK